MCILLNSCKRQGQLPSSSCLLQDIAVYSLKTAERKVFGSTDVPVVSHVKEVLIPQKSGVTLVYPEACETLQGA